MSNKPLNKKCFGKSWKEEFFFFFYHSSQGNDECFGSYISLTENKHHKRHTCIIIWYYTIYKCYGFLFLKIVSLHLIVWWRHVSNTPSRPRFGEEVIWQPKVLRIKVLNYLYKQEVRKGSSKTTHILSNWHWQAWDRRAANNSPAQWRHTLHLVCWNITKCILSIIKERIRNTVNASKGGNK